MRVLIVEDEAIILRLLTVYFNGTGHEVIPARDGLEALEEFERCTPDMILLDIGLPRLSGWDVLHAIRAKSKVPVILITALEDRSDVKKGFALGGDDFIGKPFQLHELDARMRAIMDRIAGGAGDRPPTPV